MPLCDDFKFQLLFSCFMKKGNKIKVSDCGDK